MISIKRLYVAGLGCLYYTATRLFIINILFAGGCIWGKKSGVDGREYWFKGITAINAGICYYSVKVKVTVLGFHHCISINGFLHPVGMADLQADMRDFINAPNGLSKQSLAANERVETDPSQSPLGGKTVWKLFKGWSFSFAML